MFRKIFDWTRIVVAILGPVALLVGAMFTTHNFWWLLLYIPAAVLMIVGYIKYNIDNVTDPDILFPLSAIVSIVFLPELIVNSLSEVVSSQWIFMGFAYAPLVIGIQLLEEMTWTSNKIKKLGKLLGAMLCIAFAVIIIMNS